MKLHLHSEPPKTECICECTRICLFSQGCGQRRAQGKARTRLRRRQNPEEINAQYKTGHPKSGKWKRGHLTQHPVR